LKDNGYSFIGGHRVRRYAVKGNVNWKIPEGISLDVSAVSPGSAPPRRMPHR